MTAKRHLAALAIGVGVLLAALSPAAATAGVSQSIVFGYFELEGTNDYAVEAGWLQEGIQPPRASIVARREGLEAVYETPGEPGSEIEARFGALVGEVAVRFQRQKREVEKPEKGCVWITETGVFHGRFSFTGEGGYTAAEATSAPGEIVRLPNGFCGFGDDRKGAVPDPDFIHATKLVAKTGTPNGYVAFEAAALGFASKVQFSAEAFERVGAMTISRRASASIRADKEAFLVGPGKPPSSADVVPPAPFVGRARFWDPAGAPRWTGALSVSFPGAPDVKLAGTAFTARVCLRTGILGGCKVRLR